MTMTMTTTAQIAPRAAQFAVAGFTLAAPGFADDKALRDSLDIGHIEPASQRQSYAAALKGAYARIDVRQNPALAALAANLAQLAERGPTR